MDATVGMGISIMFLRCFEQQILRYQSCSRVMKFGDYGNPPELCIWIPQLTVWLIIVVMTKIMTLYFMLQFIFPLNEFVAVLFSALPPHEPEVELVLVMIIIPTIMNTIQFWITDTFLKLQQEEETGDSELDQGLIAEVGGWVGTVELSECGLVRSYLSSMLIYVIFCVGEAGNGC